MRFYNYITEDEKELDNIFEKGIEELKKQDIHEETIELTDNQKAKLDEAVISVTFIISLLLAMPSMIKSIAKGIGWIYKKIKKLFGGKEESTGAEKIIELMDKWHHSYINILRQILRMGGVFKAAGIKNKEKQKKASEVVFYTIILGFAIHGGVLTIKSITSMLQHANTSHISVTTMEGVLTAIKSKEVKDFITQIGAAV